MINVASAVITVIRTMKTIVNMIIKGMPGAPVMRIITPMVRRFIYNISGCEHITNNCPGLRGIIGGVTGYVTPVARIRPALIRFHNIILTI